MRAVHCADHQQALAQHNPLTGLPNRTLFHDRLTEASKRARRSRMALGLLFVDLDGFKAVNDTLGHQAGDEVLRQVASRLKRAGRESDTAAHLGGDEFALIAEGLTGPGDVEIVARRVLSALCGPYPGLPATIPVTASIGVACSSGDDQVTTLVRCADAAMYDAKRAGKNRFCQWFDVKRPPSAPLSGAGT